MNQSVNNQEVAKPEEKIAQLESQSDKEKNFRRLEALRDQEKEARIRAEMQNEAMQRELAQIKQMLQPKEKDLLEDVQDLSEIDPSKFKQILAQREAQYEQKAKRIAESTIEEYEQKKKKTNFRDELRGKYHDYDSVMNEQTIAAIQEKEPEIVEAITAIEDPYVRCEKAYQFFKKKLASQQEQPKASIKEKIEENAMNPYMIPTTSATAPYNAVDFDVGSVSARKAAYEKLKSAQRRPIGGGQAVRNF